jgi:hypothetical protein
MAVSFNGGSQGTQRKPLPCRKSLTTVVALSHKVVSCTWSPCTVCVKVMGFNATFNNISVISWWSVLLVEVTEVTGENHRPVASHWQTWSHNVKCIEYTSPWVGFELTTLVMIGTDCTDSCKLNFHLITTLTAPSYCMGIKLKTLVVMGKIMDFLTCWSGKWS